MTDAEFEELLTRLDALVTEFEHHPDPAVSARAIEMLQHIDAVHREGLGRLVALIGAHDPKILDGATHDAVVRILLALYDLDPGGERERRAFIPLTHLEASAHAMRARREPEP
jgi:hypothetical protein